MRSAAALALFSLGACLFGLRASLLRLRTGCFRIRTPLGFRVGIRTGFRFARRSGSLRFVFRLLLHRHQPRFFRSLGRFLGRRFYRGLVLFLPVDLFRVQQLLTGLRQDRRRIFVGCSDMRDAHRIPRLKQLQRSLAVDAENRVLNVRVGRGVSPARHQFILGVDRPRHRRR